MNYPAIRIEGQIFSGELLQRLDQPDMSGQRPVDFGLPPEAKVKDEIARAWAASQSYYRAFNAKIVGTKSSSFATETRNLWLIPFLSLLGYNPTFSRKGEDINGKIFPISHRDDTRDGLPMHLLGWNDALDKRRDDGSGPRMSPHALVQEYLNLTEHLYALVSNGRTLRLLRDSTRLVRQSFIEFDLERIFEEDLFADFAVLFRLVHASRLPSAQATAPSSLVERYHHDAIDQGARIREGLRGAVKDALVMLGTGFLADDAIRKRLNAEPDIVDQLSPKDYYHHLLQLVYRLLFLLVAEERGLIFPVSANRNHRTIYAQYYAVSRLRRLARRPQLFEKGYTDLWQALISTFSLFEFDGPGEKLGISALGGHLFSAEAIGPLVGARLANPILLQVFHKLCYFDNKDGTKTAVNYGALATEEFGSVYESLLELNPVITGQTFSFNQVAGNERKTSGSYYTPDSLVQCLLGSALEPVIEDAIRGKSDADAADAILKLKVCDPAAGSGHFILGAAHRMARRLALIRSHGDEPSPTNYRTALRDIVSHCMYAVDINPMAIELCKVTLWLEALEPGKPLSFLDHHIQCGNSLLGATPGLIARGIPDEAFDPIEGDDKKICSALKKCNKQERTGQQDMLHLMVKESGTEHLDLTDRARRIGKIDDGSTDGVHKKEADYSALVASEEYQHSRLVADAWCAAFVWPKVTAGAASPTITSDSLHRLGTDPNALTDVQKQEVRRLAHQYQFFHWHLAFPEVFQSLEHIAKDDSKGWTGGFDVNLGNPPWERVKLQEKEWFEANGRLDIANAPNATARRRFIAALSSEKPDLWEKYLSSLRLSEGESHLIRNSGLYPLCGRGDINVYTIFAERMRNLLCKKGYFGAVLPTGVVTDETTQFFFQNVVETKSLVSVFDFENREGFFPAVDSRMKFCLFTCGSVSGATAMASDFVFFAHVLGDLRDPQRRYSLSREDMQTLNPNTLTCPVFRTRADAELSLEVHRRIPIFRRETAEQVLTPWDCDLARGFRQGEDEETLKRLGFERSKLLFTCDEVQGKSGFVPLVEGKTFDIYDHRAASIILSKSAVFRPRQPVAISIELHQDPSFTAIPYFWAQADVAKAKFPWTWFIAHKKVTSATNERTMIATILGSCAVNDTVHVFTPGPRTPTTVLPLLNANLCSFALDYFGRQKVGGNAYSMFVAKQLPLIPPSTYALPSLWAGGSTTLRDWLLPRVLELTYTAWDLETFAQDCGWPGPPFRWDEERRFLLRCELDAAFFHLYLGTPGDWDKEPAALRDSFPTPRDAAAHIMDTFPIVKRKDEAKFASYRTKDTILEIYDAMATAIQTGVAYQTRVMPEPASPAVAHPMTATVSAGKQAVVPSSFPADERDRTICAVAMDILREAGELPSETHLDALLLAAHPDWCEALLSKADQTKFTKLAARLAQPLCSFSDETVKWRRVCGYLERQQAIAVADRAGARTMTCGVQFDQIRGQSRHSLEALIPYVLKAATVVAEARANATARASIDSSVFVLVTAQHDQEMAQVA